jgi:hypothetical protein
MTYECGKNMLINPDPKIVNTRGCGPLMRSWFRRGFWVNIFNGLFGVFVGVYMMFVFQRNRKEFTQLRDEADDRKRIIRTHSTSSLRSINDQTKTNTQRYAYTGMKSSPSNGAGSGYDSDNNSASVLYQPRPVVDPNA